MIHERKLYEGEGEQSLSEAKVVEIDENVTHDFRGEVMVIRSSYYYNVKRSVAYLTDDYNRE